MNRILVATDFNDLATAALRSASSLARCAGAELLVMYADTFDPPAEFTSTQIESIAESIEEMKAHALEELRRYTAEHVGADVKWRVVVAEGTPAAAILKVAAEEQADMIALGTHGRGGLQRLMLGSVAERVMRTASVPVLTVRAGGARQTAAAL